jgi:hypothetical protein
MGGLNGYVRVGRLARVPSRTGLGSVHPLDPISEGGNSPFNAKFQLVHAQLMSLERTMSAAEAHQPQSSPAGVKANSSGGATSNATSNVNGFGTGYSGPATRTSNNDIFAIPTGDNWRLALLEAWRNMPDASSLDANGNLDESASQSRAPAPPGLKSSACVIS